MTAFESPDVHNDGSVSAAPTNHTNRAGHARAHGSLAMKVLAECFGSFLICLAIYLICSFGTTIYQVNMAFIALGIGVTYAAVTVLLGGVSGGQFNPAITLASMLTSKTRPAEGVLYIIAQVIGAIGSGAILRFLLPTSEQITLKIWLLPAVNGFENGSVAYSTINQVGLSFGIVLAIIVEIVASIVIVGAAMRSTDEDGKPRADYATVMGLSYGLGAAITYPVTGAALNPARATGIAIFAQGQGLNAEPLQQLWVFWVCPVLAAAMVALVMIVAQMAQESKQRHSVNVLDDGDTKQQDMPVSSEPVAASSVQEAWNTEVHNEQADSQGHADEGVERN